MNYPTYDKQEFGMEKGASLEDWIESFDAEKAAERGLVTWCVSCCSAILCG